ncbi:MAG: 4-alpha-glucanotransferase [Candidatus Merdivicinus sp.]|jgi:4-alpha-glucanotransferase
MRNKQIRRQAGILFPISALPAPYGIGDLGPSAYQAAEMLAKAQVHIWQILPLNPLGFGNSPYQPYSSYAGDPLYISPEILYQKKLLKRLPQPYRRAADRVDYEAVRSYKEPVFREAFRNFVPDEDYERFAALDWVQQYAVFITLKQKNGMRCWNEWPDEEKNWPQQHRLDLTPFAEETHYQIFLQYEFFCQWKALKEYANQLGLRMMGDLPFYVGIDSLDVWAGRENFLLDAEGNPTSVAGVPPDYFSPTGQRWGNPIYNWEKMEKDGFSFWVDRLQYSGLLFDLVRIDHFRAFDTYWKIPASCPTAVEGEWIEGPAYHFFDTVLPRLEGMEIVVEDLGEMRPEVYKLRDHYHFKGMKIIQFTFQPGKLENLREGISNQIVYTGTHDNQTMRGWYQSLSIPKKMGTQRSLWKAGCRTGSTVQKFIRYTLAHRAEWVIIPMQDILELDDRARINTPGTLGSPNWEWKLRDWKGLEKKLDEFAKMIAETGRS